MIKFQISNSRRAGQVLIESIIAASVAIIGLTAVLILLSKSFIINRNLKNQFIATYLAAEGIEIVKNAIDTNYADSVSWREGIDDGSYEVAYNCAGLNSVPCNKLSEEFSKNFLNFAATSGIYDYSADSAETLFIRTVKISSKTPSPGNQDLKNEIRVNAVVKWSEKGDDKEVNLEDHFFDWRI